MLNICSAGAVVRHLDLKREVYGSSSRESSSWIAQGPLAIVQVNGKTHKHHTRFNFLTHSVIF
jgi:hypothetical protein